MSPLQPGLPEEAYAAALASLPGISPPELRTLTEEDGRGVPSLAWDKVRRGTAGRRPEWRITRPDQWRRAAGTIDVGELYVRCKARGIQVVTPTSDGYPERLREDPERPTVLFRAGCSESVDLSRPTVTIVGTRQCTGYGRQVAQALGQSLGEAGVVVISGLATGIDAAAHQGALGRDGAVVGVVATGTDVVYPRSSETLWRRVLERGVLYSEKPPGYGSNPRSFVYRNRIMAGLADVVVVVESHPDGGSMSTVAAAAARGVTVMAVPGPVLASSSAGTNSLIADGCALVRDHVDVMVALELRRPSRARIGELADAAPRPEREKAGAAGQRRAERRATRLQGIGRQAPDAPTLPAATAAIRAATEEEAALLTEIDVTPTRLEVILARTGRRPGELALALDGLEAAGLVQAGPGWWARAGRD